MSQTHDLRRGAASGARVDISFEGRSVEAKAGESVSAALLCSGELVTTRSAKYRRARAPYCMRGDCGSCLVRIDGRPNQRACLTRVSEGMRVEAQNILRPDRLDPTRLIDQAFAGGMDHHHFMVKPRVLNQVMQGVARELTGLGDLPDAKVSTAEGYQHSELDSDCPLIIGGGAAGRGAAQRFTEAGFSCRVVDRLDRQALSTLASSAEEYAPPPTEQLERAGVFAAYPIEGWVVAASDEAPALRSYRARHILLATGAREAMLPLPNNDRPGVVSALGLMHLMRDNQLTLAPGALVVVGDGSHARALATQLNARFVEAKDVIDIVSGDRVKGLRTKTEQISCSFIALAPRPAPAHELAAMMGVALRFDGEGFAVQRDDDGRCGTFVRSQLWAAGDLCGYQGPDAAYADGRRVAGEMIASIRQDTARA